MNLLMCDAEAVNRRNGVSGARPAGAVRHALQPSPFTVTVTTAPKHKLYILNYLHSNHKPPYRLQI